MKGAKMPSFYTGTHFEAHYSGKNALHLVPITKNGLYVVHFCSTFV